MYRLTLGSIALVMLLAGPVLIAHSGGHHCQHCGCETCCQKVCRLVEVPKKDVCYECKCEDVCLPGPSKCCGTSCEQTCDCKCVKVHNWIPQCGTVRTKATLVKKEVESCKKEYKWVVEYVCPRCAECGDCTQQAQTVADPDAAPPALSASEANTPRVSRASFFAPLLQAFSR